MSYPDLAFAIIKYCDKDDIPHEDLRIIINKTYTKEKFSYTRVSRFKDITPLTVDNNYIFFQYLMDQHWLLKILQCNFLEIFEYLLRKEI